MRLPSVLCATVATVALVAVPGCSKVIIGSAVSGPHPPVTKISQCQHVSAPLTSIEVHAAGEPRLRIPQPPGWERASMLDSEVIRFTMRNKGLSAENFIPAAVVTLESVAGEFTDHQTIFDQERAALVERLGATGLHTTQTTLCGDKAELVDYDAPAMGRIPPRKVKTLMVAGTFSDSTFVATVTVQSTDPDNGVYASDTAMVLAGFQMLPPEGG
ncbi:MAG TPA: hypothetical protein VGG53_23865 [Mycobacterium sp.]|jgi:hypothetical protein|uniref:hypothetical protein n=1 Tax=Mycobacterium sp. TaxID=1785 RepID=UPI002F40067B